MAWDLGFSFAEAPDERNVAGDELTFDPEAVDVLGVHDGTPIDVVGANPIIIPGPTICDQVMNGSLSHTEETQSYFTDPTSAELSPIPPVGVKRGLPSETSTSPVTQSGSTSPVRLTSTRQPKEGGDMSSQAKRQRRLEKNRESAQLSRLRKRQYLESLEAKVAALEAQNAELQAKAEEGAVERDRLRDRMDSLKKAAHAVADEKQKGVKIGNRTAVLLAMLLAGGMVVSMSSPPGSPPGSPLVSTADPFGGASRRLLSPELEGTSVENEAVGYDSQLRSEARETFLVVLLQHLCEKVDGLEGAKDLFAALCRRLHAMGVLSRPTYDMNLQRQRYKSLFGGASDVSFDLFDEGAADEMSPVRVTLVEPAEQVMKFLEQPTPKVEISEEQRRVDGMARALADLAGSNKELAEAVRYSDKLFGAAAGLTGMKPVDNRRYLLCGGVQPWPSRSVLPASGPVSIIVPGGESKQGGSQYGAELTELRCGNMTVRALHTELH